MGQWNGKGYGSNCSIYTGAKTTSSKKWALTKADFSPVLWQRFPSLGFSARTRVSAWYIRLNLEAFFFKPHGDAATQTGTVKNMDF